MSVESSLGAARLYGIIDLAYVSAGQAVPVLTEMIDGGIDIVQLRAKNVVVADGPSAISAAEADVSSASTANVARERRRPRAAPMNSVGDRNAAAPLDRPHATLQNPAFSLIEELAHRLHAVSRPAGVPLIINDHPEIAAAVGCEGVHVGQDDAPIASARAVIGPGRIVGKSTHSLVQAEAAVAEGADYIGFGPLFPTPTKAGRPGIGLDDIAEVHRRVSVPIFCIGGVKIENLPAIVRAGARRVVIVSGILQAAGIAAYVREAKALLDANDK
jgi:thiamine-phosphate pyrophosphorylase